MAPPDPFRIPIADLLRQPGGARDFAVEGNLSELENGSASVPGDEPIRAEGTLEHIADGVVVRALVQAPWIAPCSRCLRPVSGELAVHVDELFEPAPLEGETYLLDGDILDVSPLVRDALVLELPLAPRCAEECAGICPSCGADRNTSPCACTVDDLDPRWAALRGLQ
jgi:uncharacterized protein